jgi:hypothetical protein
MAGNQRERILPELVIVASVVVTVFGAALLAGQDQTSWRVPVPFAATQTDVAGTRAVLTPTPTRPGEKKSSGSRSNPLGVRTAPGTSNALPGAGAPRLVTPTPTPIPSPTPVPTVVG